ncbi:hypothetical protein ACFLVR_04575 [Chloroflexota bacterium]
MSLKAVRTLVKKTFTDSKFKRSLLANPDKALSKFDLTDEEKGAIINVHTSVGVVDGNSAALEATVKPMVTWSR